MKYIRETGVFIRFYLEEKKEACPYEVYKALKKVKKLWNLRPGSYQSMRNHFFWIRKLGLIEFTREETSQGPPTFKSRRLYSLTEKGRRPNVNDPKWANPRRALYPASWKRRRTKLQEKGAEINDEKNRD